MLLNRSGKAKTRKGESSPHTSSPLHVRGHLTSGFIAFCFLLSGLHQANAGPAGLLSADDLTVPAGASGTISILWSSTQSLTYLNTQFVLRAVTGTAGGATFTEGLGLPGEPLLFPPINDSNYVFYGDSSSFISFPASNPASVTMDAWAGDSYILADATDSGLDALQSGSELWTSLSITGVAAGTYQLHLLNSEYEYTAIAGAALPLTDADLTGGLITVTSTVPESSGFAAVSLVLGAACLIRCRRARVA